MARFLVRVYNKSNISYKFFLRCSYVRFSATSKAWWKGIKSLLLLASFFYLLEPGLLTRSWSYLGRFFLPFAFCWSCIFVWNCCCLGHLPRTRGWGWGRGGAAKSSAAASQVTYKTNKRLKRGGKENADAQVGYTGRKKERTRKKVWPSKRMERKKW